MTDTDWRLTPHSNQPRDGRGRRLPKPLTAGITGPESYIAHPNLIDAVNTALALGQPLLVTGDPGCGKTELGDYIAWKLDLGLGEKRNRAIRLDVKTDMRSHELFYSFDAVGRFHAAQRGARDDKAAVDAINFLRYHGLGEAVARATEPERLRELGAFPPGFEHKEKRRCVVLIDEIDKASRDVPNNLLRVMEAPCFSIPELGYVEVLGDRDYQPILVLTSNSEKMLPDAFLRRCVYYHMSFPDDDTLRQIVAARISDFPGDCALVSDAVTAMRHLRERNLRKPPCTSELLTFILVLRGNGFAPEDRLAGSEQRWLPWAIVNFLKTRDDQEDRPQQHFADIDWTRGRKAKA